MPADELQRAELARFLAAREVFGMWRMVPGRRTAGAAGGLIAAGLLDRALAPQLKPLSSVAAAAVGTSQSIGPVRVYQYAICPFCNKVKSLLDLYQVPYEAVDVNPLTKKEIKAWSGGYRKVPISMFGDEQVNDSPVIATRIMDELEAAGTIPKKDAARFRSPAALKWAEWSDKEFAVLLFPNITRNFDEAYEAFGYVHEVPHFSLVDKWSNQFVGAFAMWMAQGKIKKKYGIEDERAAVYVALVSLTPNPNPNPNPSPSPNPSPNPNPNPNPDLRRDGSTRASAANRSQAARRPTLQTSASSAA